MSRASNFRFKAGGPTSVSPKKLVKQCVGIDVSKDHLDVCFSQMDDQQTIIIKSTKKFANRIGGWKALEAWLKRFSASELPLWLVMEATVVY